MKNSNQKIEILFFDGVCSLCNAFIDLLIRHSKENTNLKVASIQGSTAKELLPKDVIENIDYMVFYEDGKLYTKSSAFIKVMVQLNFPWNLFKLLIVVPSFLRDIVYSIIAKRRYKLFGKRETCRIPTDAERQFFLQ